MNQENWIRRFADARLKRIKQRRWDAALKRAAPYLQQQVHDSLEIVSGPTCLPISDTALALVTMTRESEHFIKAFIEYHLGLGCEWIVILDNGSQDRTVEFARSYDRVTVLRSALPFGNFKTPMRHYLMRRFCKNRWCLRVDSDELFDYPGSSRFTPTDLLAYLDSHRYTAVLGYMLGLFPRGPLLHLGDPPAQQSLIDTHCWYDLNEIERKPYRYEFYGNLTPKPTPQVYYGGIRSKAFGFNPLITKHPLVFCEERILKGLGNAHSVRHARIADFSVVLRHYKFGGDFVALITRAIQEQGYFSGSVEYRHYERALSAEPELSLWSPQSHQLICAEQLLHHGFLFASERFRTTLGGS